MTKSLIEWTDETWNPVTGCTKVSAGCKYCYAERAWSRLSAKGMPYEGRAFTDVQCHPERLEQPLRWKKPRRVFVNSMSDLFHEDVPFEFIAAVFGVMSVATRHTFQILTKRPQRMLEWFDWANQSASPIECMCAWSARAYLLEQNVKDYPFALEGLAESLIGHRWPRPNVWLGISAEDQATAEERIPLLLQTPAAVRFVSLEPLLGPVDLERILWPEKGGHRVDVLRGGYWNKAGITTFGPSAELGQTMGGFTNHSDMQTIDWVIVGGESGPKARPMHPDWVRDIRDQCVEATVPFFFKQWGEWAVTYDRDRDDPDWRRCPKSDGPSGRYINLAGGFGFHGDRVSYTRRIGKKAAGRELDGRTWEEYPV